MTRVEYESIKALIKIKDNLNKHNNALNISPYSLSDLAKVVDIHIQDRLYMAEPTVLQ